MSEHMWHELEGNMPERVKAEILRITGDTITRFWYIAFQGKGRQLSITINEEEPDKLFSILLVDNIRRVEIAGYVGPKEDVQALVDESVTFYGTNGIAVPVPISDDSAWL